MFHLSRGLPVAHGRHNTWAPTLVRGTTGGRGAILSCWPAMQHERLKKLAQRINDFARADQSRIREEAETRARRQQAAVELHNLCVGFVNALNSAVDVVKLELSPGTFTPENFQEDGWNLFQINVSGRVIQFSFRATNSLVSTEELRMPYTLEGSVRWFNQQMIDLEDVRDHRLFYLLDKKVQGWRSYDPLTRRLAALNEDYLADLLEELAG